MKRICFVDKCTKEALVDNIYCKKHDKSKKVHKLVVPKALGFGKNVPA